MRVSRGPPSFNSVRLVDSVLVRSVGVFWKAPVLALKLLSDSWASNSATSASCRNFKGIGTLRETEYSRLAA